MAASHASLGPTSLIICFVPLEKYYIFLFALFVLPTVLIFNSAVAMFSQF